MISAIRQFFDDNLKAGEAENHDTERRVQLACAALLIELMKTDARIDERETETLTRVLGSTFGLGQETLRELVRLADDEANNATSLYEFTSLINSEYEYEDKLKLIENMWRIAFADGELDKYEDHLIRKTSELIYVRHSDFIQTKLKVKVPSL